MWHPLRRIKAEVAVRLIKKAIGRLPGPEQEFVMETLKRIVASRAQIVRVIGAIVAGMTALGLDPQWIKPLHDLGQAVQQGDAVAVASVLFLGIHMITGILDRDKQDRAHAELMQK